MRYDLGRSDRVSGSCLPSGLRTMATAAQIEANRVVLGDMLERQAIWTLTDLYRSIRLQGKHPVDAINDPGLNLQIQAWEMVSPGAAVDFWERCYHQTPKVDPGFRGFMEWREIADRPADEDEALLYIKGV